jgi:phosphate:Na+ symporter
MWYNFCINLTSAICLFLYAVDRFSKEVTSLHSQKFSNAIKKACSTNFTAALSGCILTAIIQSSTAVSSMAVGLVDAGVLSLSSALSVMLGAGVGTSSTALLASLKINNLSSILLIFGFFLGIDKKHTKYGHIIFYLGLLLVSLKEISYAVSYVQQDPLFVKLLTHDWSTFTMFWISIIVTIILQSSSLVTSIIVMLVHSNTMAIDNAVVATMGAFSGTTLTAFIVSLRLSKNARKAGLANLVIVLTVSLLMLFFVKFFTTIVYLFEDKGFGIAISNIFVRLFGATLGIFIFKAYTHVGGLNFLKKFSKLNSQ